MKRTSPTQTTSHSLNRCALGRIDVASIMPQTLSDPDPQFEAILPRIRRLFYEAGGDSMAADAFQLDSILNTILKEDHRLPYSLVCWIYVFNTLV